MAVVQQQQQHETSWWPSSAVPRTTKPQNTEAKTQCASAAEEHPSGRGKASCLHLQTCCDDSSYSYWTLRDPFLLSMYVGEGILYGANCHVVNLVLIICLFFLLYDSKLNVCQNNQ